MIENKVQDAITDWQKHSFRVGDIVNGFIQKIVSYGAFVRLNGGFIAFIHRSDLGEQHIKNLKVGDAAGVRIIGINEETQHIGLS